MSAGSVCSAASVLIVRTVGLGRVRGHISARGWQQQGDGASGCWTGAARANGGVRRRR